MAGVAVRSRVNGVERKPLNITDLTIFKVVVLLTLKMVN